MGAACGKRSSYVTTWSNRESMALSGLSTGSLYVITVPSFKHLETNHPVGACAKKAKWNGWIYWNSLRNEGWAVVLLRH